MDSVDDVQIGKDSFSGDHADMGEQVSCTLASDHVVSPALNVASGTGAPPAAPVNAEAHASLMPFEACISPTVPWKCTTPLSQEIGDLGSDVKPHSVPGLEAHCQTSWISAAPLLGLQDEQFLQLRVPAVVNEKHLLSLRNQVMHASDRNMILDRQSCIWSDDELRHHIALLVQRYDDQQKAQGMVNPRTCIVLDPLLSSGWLHHGFHECRAWGENHPEVRSKQCIVVTACMIAQHWIPVVFTPHGDVLHVYTWDAPNHDHSLLNQMCDILAKSLGFQNVAVERHHRLFLTTNKCGALAMAFLSFSLNGTMLPTTVEETDVIHHRLKTSFANVLTTGPMTTRPWIWGCGDTTVGDHELQVMGESLHLDDSHVCIPVEQRLELLRAHGKELGDDEIKYHIQNMLDYRNSLRRRWNHECPGFVVMDPLTLRDWETTGKAACAAWCTQHPEVVADSHNIVASLLVDHHWVPLWIEPCQGYLLVHLLHDGVTKLDQIRPLLDFLSNQFGFHEHVIHWTPQNVENHALCGTASICFLGHVILDADLPGDVTALNYAHSNMKASFVQAIHQGKCCMCPHEWGSGSQPALSHSVSIVTPWFDSVPDQSGESCQRLPQVNDDRSICPPKCSATESVKLQRNAVDRVNQPHHEGGEAHVMPDALASSFCLPSASISGKDRILLLDQQQGVCGNDEIHFHLQHIIDQVPFVYAPLEVPKMALLDPVLFTQCVSDDSQVSYAASALCDKDICVITVCCLNSHWIPVLLCRKGQILSLVTWDATDRVHPLLQSLREQIACSLGNVKLEIQHFCRDFQSDDRCGALAVGFLSHTILGSELPNSSAELDVVHSQLRNSFRDALAVEGDVCAPVIWGSGDSSNTAGSSDGAGPGGHVANRCSLSHTCLSPEHRLELLRLHEREWGDDEIRFHLNDMIGQFERRRKDHSVIPGFVTLDPLFLVAWDTVGKPLCESWARTHPQIKELGFHIVTVQLVDHHWVPIWIVPHQDQLTFHLMHDGITTAGCILPLVEVLCTQLGFAEHVVHWFPQSLPDHDYCGAAAVAFLGQIIVGEVFPSTLDRLKDVHSNLRASFVQAVLTDQCCRCSVAWGSGPSAALVTSLAEILAKHGVPESLLEQRALQAIRAIGTETIQTALKAKNVWRSLKAVGSNAKFQFILPDELETMVNANKGATVGKKIKPSKINTKVPVPSVLDPMKLTLLEGTFRSGGQPLPQIAAQQIGPVAHGVAFLSLKDATPYLRAGKTVSSGPLAMIVLDEPPNQVQTSLPHTTMMVPCLCSANQEPLLVEATLVQLGQGIVEKHVAASAIALDPLDVVSVKIMTYRDECPVPWEEFVHAPIKQLVQMFPLLRRCHESPCTCDCWHNPDNLQVKEPIMDVWRRQFLTSSFRPTQASKSDIFSVCLRVPASILPSLLAASGISGSYMEPRTPDGKQVMEEYVVIWAPRMNASELSHLKQTNPGIIGIARLGDRRGVCVKQAQAPAIHAIVRPETPFLPNGPKVQYCAGPFPWGTDRAAITRAMRQVGWQVQALQPMQPVPGKGSMWLLQSVDSPPESILSTSHGDVVITKHKAVAQQTRPAGSFTVGSVSTLSLCGPESVKSVPEQDPWLHSDPWGPYNKSRAPAQATAAADGMQQLEERIQSAVLPKLPTNMEQDDTPERLTSLEEKVQMLMGKNQSLEAQFNDFSAHSNQQFAVVQSQIQQQSSQFHGQLESQSQSIQAMFEQQMNQIRGPKPKAKG